MNDKARELLIKAALDGVPQVHGTLFSGEGRCAMGVIIEGLGLKEKWYVMKETPPMLRDSTVFWREVFKEAGMNPYEHGRVVEMNDSDGFDFLTIARKLGNE